MMARPPSIDIMRPAPLENHPLAPSPRKTAKLRKEFSCTVCHRSFSRSEHCVRHQRGHTHEKPFPCKHCGRHFARKDLVNRHERSFHPFEIRKRQEAQETASVDKVGVVSNQLASPDTESVASSSSQAASSANMSGSVPHLTVLARTKELPAGSENYRPPQPLRQLLDKNIIHPSIGSAEYDFARLQPAQSDMIIVQSMPSVSAVTVPPATQEIPTLANTQHLAGAKLQEHFDWGPEESLIRDSVMGDSNAPNAPISEHTNQQGDPDFISMLNEDADATYMDFDFSVSNLLFDSTSHTFLDNGIANRWEESDVTPCTASANNDCAKSSTEYESVVGAKKAFSKVTPSLLRVAKEKPRDIQAPSIDENVYSTMLQVIQNRLSFDALQDLQLPNMQSLNSFLKGYLYCFHSNFPIMHLPHLHLAETSTPLILSMCAIGALYRLNRKAAKNIWLCASMLANAEVRELPHRTIQLHDIWVAQYKLLLTFYAVLNGDSVDATASLDMMTYWTTEYRLRRAELTRKPAPTGVLNWSDWSQREASKRLLYGILILSSLMTVTYGTAPSFSLTQDLDLELPEAEHLWEAMTEEQWKKMLTTLRTTKLMTVREAMTHLISGNEKLSGGPERWKTWSSLTTLVVMYAVNIQMWNIAQVTQSLTMFAIDGEVGTDIKAPLLCQIETSLARCYALLTADRSELDRSPNDSEGPILFNCLALLRIAYLRLFTGIDSIDRTILLREDTEHISTSIQNYVTCVQERRPFLTQTVVKAYEGMISTFQPGYFVVRKTAALNWSVEHAISNWDSALFVTKWVHTMQKQQLHPNNPLSDEELAYFANFKNLISEWHSEFEMGESLAADITKIWASCFDDTWVWGVTFRIGRILRLLSTAYEEDWRISSSQALVAQ